MFVGQVSTIGTLVTVTENMQLVLWLQESLAVQFTGVVPMGKVLPLGGLQIKSGVLQPPEIDGLKLTTAPFVPVAPVTVLEGPLSSPAVS